MQKKGAIFLFIVLLNCFVPVSAQTDMYMNVDPIRGESTNPAYLNWINIYGYNAGSNTPVSIGGAGGGAGRTSTNDFTFSMCVDKSLNELKLKMYRGQQLPNVRIDFLRQGPTTQTVYYRIEFVNAFITKIEEAGTTNDGRPLCNISLTPSKFRYSYWPTIGGGNQGTPVIFGWDVAANIAW